MDNIEDFVRSLLQKKSRGGVTTNVIADAVLAVAKIAAAAYAVPEDGIPLSVLDESLKETLQSVAEHNNAIKEMGGAMTEFEKKIELFECDGDILQTNARRFLFLGTDGEYHSLQDEIERIGIKSHTMDTPQSSVALRGNEFFDLGTLGSSLELSLMPYYGDDLAVYACSFKTGAMIPSITWPAGIKSWYGEAEPTINSGKYYEISICNGLAICAEF